MPFIKELVATFKCYFDVLKAVDDKPRIENPFYLFPGDKFWRVTPLGENEPLYREETQIIRPSESTADTQPKLQPAF